MDNVNSYIPTDTKIVFKELFKSIISDFYGDLIDRGKEPCSFGIYTDSDMTSFILALNTHRFSNTNQRLVDKKWWTQEHIERITIV